MDYYYRLRGELFNKKQEQAELEKKLRETRKYIKVIEDTINKEEIKISKIKSKEFVYSLVTMNTLKDRKQLMNEFENEYTKTAVYEGKIIIEDDDIEDVVMPIDAYEKEYGDKFNSKNMASQEAFMQVFAKKFEICNVLDRNVFFEEIIPFLKKEKQFLIDFYE